MQATVSGFRIACPVCFEEYDEYQRVPRLISPRTCCHSVCSMCLSKVLEWKPECPLCRTTCSLTENESRVNIELQGLCDRLRDRKLFFKTLMDMNEKGAVDYRRLARRYNILLRESNREMGQQRQEVVEQVNIPYDQLLDTSSFSFIENTGMRQDNWQERDAINTINNLESVNEKLWGFNNSLEIEYQELKNKYELLEIDIWTEREGVKNLFVGYGR